MIRYRLLCFLFVLFILPPRNIVAYFVSTNYEDIRPLELYNVALNIQRTGDFVGAISVYEEALTMFPEFPEAHQNLGHLYETQNNIEKSKYHHLLSIKHASSEWFNASAIVNFVLIELRTMPIKRISELQWLIELLNDALNISPNNTNVLYTLSQIYESIGDIKICAEYLRKVISIDDRHVLAWLNLGNQWFKANNHEIATKFYKNALERIPEADVYTKVLVLNNMGQCYRERGLMDLAYQSFYTALQSLSTGPYNGNITTNTTPSISSMLSGGEYYGKPIHFWCLNNVYTIQGMLCNWRHYDLLEHHIEAFLTLSYSKHPSADELHNIASFTKEGVMLDAYTLSLLRYGTKYIDKYICQQSCLTKPVAFKSADSHDSSNIQEVNNYDRAIQQPQQQRKQLKIAYLSHDWRDHPMGRLTASLIAGHSQDRVILSTFDPILDTNKDLNFSTTAMVRMNSSSISYGDNDHSEVREFMMRFSTHFVDVLNQRNDIAVAERLAEEEYDIVIDITAHTYNGRIDIAATKPASIAINYLGFPGSTGCEGFDYTMVTATIVPPELAVLLFTEHMLYLPHTYQSNDMVLRVAPVRNKSLYNNTKKPSLLVRSLRSDHSISTGAYDLPIVPANKLLICSFNANKKMEIESFHAWMNILARVPKAILLLLEVSADVKGYLTQELSYYGMKSSRIVYIPKRKWKEHLKRSSECDLVLDTFVYGAHTTASDVLWMGVPLLSLTSYGSERMPSRVAASITQSLGLASTTSSNTINVIQPADILVVDSILEYENVAVSLLHTMQATRAALSDLISYRAVTAPTFDSELMQKSIECAYQLAHEVRTLRSLPTAAFSGYHIVIPSTTTWPSSNPTSSSSSATKDGVVRIETWRKKFSRDFSACCRLPIDDMSALFNSTPSHLVHDQVVKIMEKCTVQVSQQTDGVCVLEDLSALVRRLLIAHPHLEYLHPRYTSLASDDTTVDRYSAPNTSVLSNSEHASSPTTVDAPSTSAPATTTETPHTLAEDEQPSPSSLLLDCPQLLSMHTTVHTLKNCISDANNAHTGSQLCTQELSQHLAQCYNTNALSTMDYIISLQQQLIQENLHAAETFLIAMLQPILFEARRDSTAYMQQSRAVAHTLLQEHMKTSKFLSPLWRTCTVEALRTIVLHTLLPLHAPSILHAMSSTAFTATHQIRLFPNKLSLQDTKSFHLNGTVCRNAFHQYGLYYSIEIEQEECERILSIQIATMLTEHSLLLTAYQSNHNNHINIDIYSNSSSNTISPLIIAFMLDSTDQRLMNIGTVLQEHGESEIGFFLSSIAVFRMAKALPLSTDVREKLPFRPSSSIKAATLPRIIFYCNEYGQAWWPGWGPSSLLKAENNTTVSSTAPDTSSTSTSGGSSPAKGMGGSEEAVYYTSIELARRGHNVVIYAGVTEADHGHVQYYNSMGQNSPFREELLLLQQQQVEEGGGGDVVIGSVTWLHYDYYNPLLAIGGGGGDNTSEEREECEIFIAWRYAISLGLARSKTSQFSTHPSSYCGRSYLWLHDLIPGHILPPSYFLQFDGIYVQSQFHKEYVLNNFMEYALSHTYIREEAVESKIFIISNGITLDKTMYTTSTDATSAATSSTATSSVNHNNIFIYASSPGRGLALVLSQWSVIKQYIPTAVLQIYYGFTPSVLRELRQSLGSSFAPWYAQMQVYLQQDGVEYYGTVDHHTLFTASASAGFILYPTTFQETGCITLIRAMASGAIPITSKLTPSVLPHLTGIYDLGPALPLSYGDSQDPERLIRWLREYWTPSVINAYYMDPLELNRHRIAMKTYIQSVYSWENTAKNMEITWRA